MTKDARKSAKRLAFAGFLYPLWEFGARKYFTGHHTSYTIQGFGDSFLVCTIHDRYCRVRKNFEQAISFFPIQATQTNVMVRLDENKPPQNAFKRI